MADTGLAEVAPSGYWDLGVPRFQADAGSRLLRKLSSQSAILSGDLAGSGSQLVTETLYAKYRFATETWFRECR